MKAFATTGLLALSLLALPAPSRADVRVGVGIRIDNGYYYDGRYPDTIRIAYHNGYDDGYHEGAKDARHHERFSYWDEGRYRDGDHGYHGRYGPRWEYVSGYRRGFESGYRRAYQANFRYDDHDRYYDHDRDDRRW
jgi:hypothetical protein